MLQCNVVSTKLVANLGYTAYCQTHNRSTTNKWTTEGKALREFRCDKGAGWLFVVEPLNDEWRTAMEDLTGLNRAVLSAFDAADYGEEYRLNVYLWDKGGKITALTVSAQVSTSGGAFNEYLPVSTQTIIVKSDDDIYYLVTSRTIDRSM